MNHNFVESNRVGWGVFMGRLCYFMLLVSKRQCNTIGQI